MKLQLVPSCFAALLVLASCSQSPESSKYKAYLYKQPEPDGLICVFYSNHPGIAERNAQMFATLHEEKYGVAMIVRSEPYR